MNILVTGISRGLGIEIADYLLSNGHKVYGINRSMTGELDSLLKKYPNNLHVSLFDLSHPGQIKQLINGGNYNDLQFHGFVNNAAMAYDDLISNLSYEKLEGMFRLNVFTPMVITKYVIRNMLLHQTTGSIVHISSICVHTGYKGLAMYASTKGALEAFSKNTAREWGEKGIRSNCVVAGFMETDMNANLKIEQKEKIYQRTSLKRSTSLKSVAEMVSYLLSDSAISITGQNIFVDSGTI